MGKTAKFDEPVSPLTNTLGMERLLAGKPRAAAEKIDLRVQIVRAIAPTRAMADGLRMQFINQHADEDGGKRSRFPHEGDAACAPVFEQFGQIATGSFQGIAMEGAGEFRILQAIGDYHPADCH